MLRRHGIGQERQVVPEEQHRLWVDNGRVGAEQLLEHHGRHRRHVFMAKPQVAPDEPLVPGADARHTDGSGRCIGHPMAGEDLLGNGERPWRRIGQGNGDRPSPPGDVVRVEPAVLDDACGDRPLSRGEGGKRDGLASLKPWDEGKVGRGQEPEVLAVLAVDALEAFSEDDADAGRELGVGGRLTGGPFAPASSGDGGDEVSEADGAAGDRKHLTSPEPEVRKVPECRVEVVADVGRRDFVGRDVIAEGGRRRDVLARQLPLDQRRVIGEEEHAAR